VDTPQEVLSHCNILLKVNPPTKEEVQLLRKEAVVVSFMDPFNNEALIKIMAEKQLAVFSMELIPRISRAQSMDALSSQASIAGYKSVLLAANKMNKFFPMLTTAAGTVRPAQTLIMGAGVAGLQAIATAKRLGSRVLAFDVRASSKEQIESLGAKFLDTGVSAEGEGGYARELNQEELTLQKETLSKTISESDVVITTAAVPGKPAPRLIDQKSVEAMQPGSVIIDLGAMSGGNCELTKPDELVNHNGVIILGPTNLAATMPKHASELYARNLANFITPALGEGELKIDWDDEIFSQSNLTKKGNIVFNNN
jgi:NAD(P) transhydrogenase subunit alpha